MIYIKKITKQKYLRLFTLFPNLITKESYGRWITRRKLGFRHQISEAKCLKMLVANIWKHSGAFRKRTRWLRKGWFRSAAKLTFSLMWLASNGSNFSISTSIHVPFEVLDCWLPETTYGMHQLDSRKCSKSSWHDYHQECFMTDFSLLPLLAFRICLWQRTSNLWFFMSLSFPLLFHGFQITLLNLELLWWSKSYQNTKT